MINFALIMRIIYTSLIILSLIGLHPPVAFAQDIDICAMAGGGSLYADCIACTGTDGSGGGIWTGLGCISFNPQGFVSNLLNIGVGLGGGFALLLLLYGSFLLATSSGNPEQVQKGKEVATSAIAGLLFIIFSIYIMNLVGVKILRIPDF